jgi:hypothetical protein
VLASAHASACKSGSNFKAFGRGDGEHSMCQQGLNLIERRLTPAGRDASANASDNTTNRVLLLLQFCD